MGTPATGALTRMAFDTALPFDTNSKAIEIISSTFGKQGQILSTDGLRGTRQYHNSRTRKGPYSVSGQIVVAASPLFHDMFLPMILGAVEATDVFDLAESLPLGYLMWDSGTKVTTWSNVIVSRASLRGTVGQMCQWTLDLEAESESIGDAGTFPALTMPTDSPYCLHDGVLTLQADTREYSEFELVIDNQIDTQRWQNAITRSKFPSSGVQVSLNTNHPWSSDEVDLYDQALYGAAGSLVLTNADVGTNVCTIALGFLQAPAQHPQAPGRGEIRLPLQMTARQSESTPSIRITNAHA